MVEAESLSEFKRDKTRTSLTVTYVLQPVEARWKLIFICGKINYGSKTGFKPQKI